MTAGAASDAAVDHPLLAVSCPACHAALAAERALVGTPGRCPVCRAGFMVPLPPRPRPQVSAGAESTDEELRRLEREGKSRRRARRNLVMLLSGIAILLVIVLTLGTRSSKKRR